MKRFLSLLLVFVLPVAAFSQTGNIKGTVYRSVTGAPLVGVDVRLTKIDKSQKTDENGNFVFKNIPEGNYTLFISLPDSEILGRTSVVVRANQNAHPEIYVEMYRLEKIEVKRERSPKTVSRKSLRGQEMARLPGTGGDVLRALPSLPGIGVSSDFSGALYIRGGSDEDNLYYFDRIPFGYPYHFGSLVSSLSSTIIERIDVYAGGYGAEFGINSQAVIDIHSQDRSPPGLHGKFNLNLLYSETVLQGTIREKGYWYVAGRRSYIDLFVDSLSFNTSQITAFPRFWDYQFKTAYNLNEMHRFSMNLFASGDRFALRQEGQNVDEDFQGNLQFQTGFNGAGIHLRSLLSERLNSFLSVTRSDVQFDIDIGPDIFLEVEAPDYVLREDLMYTVSPKYQLESGLVLALQPGRVTGTFSRLPDEGEADYDFRFAERKTLDESILGHRIEGYLQNRLEPLPFLSLVFGLRADYFNGIDRLAIQPRGSLLIELPNRSELQFSFGIYNQSPQPWLLSPTIGNPNLSMSRASHYILELKRQLFQDTEITMAGYYKDFRALATIDEEAGYLNQGVGYAQGTEIFLRHRHGTRFFGWFSYAYALSKRKSQPDKSYRFYSFDQTHTATLVGSYAPSSTWEIGAKWQYHTGNPYTPIIDATLGIDPRNGKTIWVPIYAAPNSERLPPYHRLDLRVSKIFNHENWQMNVYFELLNVYNRQNLLQYNYSSDYQFKSKISQFPLIPYVGFSAKF